MIRTAKIEDAAAIAGIHIETWQHACAGLMPAEFLKSLSVAKRAEQWRKALKKTTDGTLVHESAGVVTGFASFGACLDPDRANASDLELYAIYVRASDKRQGVGRRLAEKVEADCRERGAGSISLWVLEMNKPARAFYETMGYAHDGTSETVSMGGKPFEKFRYLKRLSRP